MFRNKLLTEQEKDSLSIINSILKELFEDLLSRKGQTLNKQIVKREINSFNQ